MIIISVFILSLNVSDKGKFVIRSNITKCTVVMNRYIELKYFVSYRARKELSKDMVTCVYREKQTCANIEKLRASPKSDVRAPARKFYFKNHCTINIYF